ncbi:MAG: anthranilate synthase component I family protein [Bacteroidetes bacterium]|nr:anthranilate synthase component I family protein [Bacteroidota bacterium]
MIRDKRKIETVGWSNNMDLLLHIAALQDISVLLNPFSVAPGYTTVLAIGDKQSVSGKAKNAFWEIAQLKKYADHIFGFFAYDLKNEIENLQSENLDGSDFPDYFFFQPKLIVRVSKDKLQLEYFEEDAEFTADIVANLTKAVPEFPVGKSVVLKPRVSKEKYIDTVNQLKNHIHRGDVYEVNFCQEFFAENATIQVQSVFQDLMKKSPTPFSCFVKMNEQYLLCASPERFLKKEGSKVLSQPIKGTAKRGANEEEDQQNIKALSESSKEKSENVMIVDLVRNDLSTVALAGTVKVDELFGIHTFQQWHQMISTVSCEVDESISSLQVIKKCFPMGSMTGAPKVRAMQLIEQYESMKRGIYSGAVGYIDESNNFDFNVVIRSVAYNETKKYVSVCVGSAITANCDAQQEYDECLTKAEVLFKVLNNEK